jgi:eukaryotic-like serine/threonine-protein kinase
MVDAGVQPIDRYVVLEHLSEGGMGAIYVGKKLGAGGFEMEVVLKQLLPEFTQQEEFIDLFLREAKISATLDHANIVHTIDLVTAGGEYFIVMEYLPGGDLRTLLKRAKRRGKRFSPAAAIYICREVLSALAYAHTKRDFDGAPLRLIHRDVSPSNILVSYAGECKLTDFGIAKAATHNSLFYKVKGKIGYMSPEQAKSEPLDHRSDLYSLAVCLYEVLTGERLFVHAGLTTSADEIYSQPIPQVSRKVPGLTPDLDKIMAKALALNPAVRYQTASEFQEALTRCAHRNGLLMSAPELSRELLDACGPTDQWRDDEGDEEVGARAGTELYDPASDPDVEPSFSPVSIHSLAAAARAKSDNGGRPTRPKTEFAKLAQMELTSIINMMEVENRDGAKPLVDLDAGPRLDSLQQKTPEPTQIAPAPPPPTPPARPTGGQSFSHVPYARPPEYRPPPPAAVRPPPAFMPQRRKRAWPIQPWMVIVAILVVAGVAAIIVAMSGPQVSTMQHK